MFQLSPTANVIDHGGSEVAEWLFFPWWARGVINERQGRDQAPFLCS